jgi:WhiB family redox-sensing transcriptional regulator
MTTTCLAAPTGWSSAIGGVVTPCQREDLRLWFSERPHELDQAKAFCQPCPLRALCLAEALERGEPHGVWGGEIFDSGVIIERKRPRGRPPKDRSPALTSCTR